MSYESTDSLQQFQQRTRAKYIKHAEERLAHLKEHGAIKVVECWGDDVPDGKVTAHPMAVAARGRRDGRVRLDRVALEGRCPRCRHEESNGRPAHAGRHQPHAFDGKRLIFGGFDMLFER